MAGLYRWKTTDGIVQENQLMLLFWQEGLLQNGGASYVIRISQYFRHCTSSQQIKCCPQKILDSLLQANPVLTWGISLNLVIAN